jgi:hypothetical protein
MAGLGTRSAIERAEIGNSRPKAARASALPDRRRRAEHPLAGDRGETLSSPTLTTVGQWTAPGAAAALLEEPYA